MSTSFNGTSPQAPVRVATVSRERTPAEAVARQSHSDRPPVREQEAKPHARQGRRSVRMTLLLLVLIPLAVAGAAYYYARSQSFQSTDDAFIDDHVSNAAPKLLQQQASLWAYVDLFRLLALACAVLVPLVFLFKKGSQPTSGTAMAH